MEAGEDLRLVDEKIKTLLAPGGCSDRSWFLSGMRKPGTVLAGSGQNTEVGRLDFYWPVSPHSGFSDKNGMIIMNVIC